jgi:hypothetical protein
MTGTSERIVDTASGAFIESYRIGPTSGGSGFDGRTPWWKDVSGTFTPQLGGDKLALAVKRPIAAPIAGGSPAVAARRSRCSAGMRTEIICV